MLTVALSKHDHILPNEDVLSSFENVLGVKVYPLLYA